MFCKQRSFRGVAMFRRGEDGGALTLWQHSASVAALAHFNFYGRTVETILAEGFPHGKQTVEIFGLHLLPDLAD